MLGGAEARLVAQTCHIPWRPLHDHASADDLVVVFGTFEELLAVLRTRPASTLWRPTNHRLPLPPGAAWALRRLHRVVAPDEVTAAATRAAGASTVVVAPMVPPLPTRDATRASGRTRGPGPPGAELLVGVVLDTLDHHAGAALAVLAGLARGRLRWCSRCDATLAPRVDPVRAGPTAVTRCPCGSAVEVVPARPLRAFVAVLDESQPLWGLEYLRGLRSWLGLADVVELDDGPVAVEEHVMGRLQGVHVALAAGSGPAAPRGALLAAGAGVPALVPDHGEAASGRWGTPCAVRTETVADGSVRVHLDPGATARALLAVSAARGAPRRAPGETTSAWQACLPEVLAPQWWRVLARADSSVTRPGLVSGRRW